MRPQSKGAPDDENTHNKVGTPWVNIGAVGLRTENARRLRDGGRPQPAKAYCQAQRRGKGWQQKPRWYPRVGYIHGPPHLGRRAPKGGRNFSTTGPTALIAAHGQGLTPTVKSAAPVIHPRKVRLIDILLPPASSGLWRAPRLLFTRSERRQHETPPYLGLVRGPTSLVLLGEKLVLTQPARNSGTTRSPLSSLPRHRPRPGKSSE